MSSQDKRSNYQTLLNLCLKHTNNLVIVLSKALTIESINSSATKLLGWKKNDVLNKRISDVFYQTTTEPFIDINNPVIKTKNTTHITNKGNYLKITWNIVPLYNAEHHCDLIFILGKSATELSKKQLKNLPLKNVVKFAPELFYWKDRIAPGLFYWKDKNSIYQGCNDEFAQLAGLESWVQVIGKTDFELVWKDRAQQYINIDKKVLETGKAVLNHEEMFTASDQRIITVLTNTVPILNNSNNVIGVMGITTDITQQKKVEQGLSIAKEQAEAANRAKSKFIANMSHDIRTPIIGIIGMSGIIEQETTNENDKKSAHMINASGEQLLSLLNSILEVSSADNINDSDLHEETFDLRVCIQDIAELELPTTQLKQLDLHINIDENIPQYIISDRTKIHRILLNLLGNAIKFTKKGFVAIEIKLLSLTKEQVSLQFSVADSGIGVTLEAQNKVFDRFFRATPSNKGTYSGNGVGLHIAQSYVKLLGSEIKLRSKEDVGSTFYFQLSCKIGEKSQLLVHSPHYPAILTQNTYASTPPKKQATAPTYTNTALILVVEDSPVALTIATSIIKRAGYRFIAATSGEEAFELFQSHTIGLVLTDIGLPGISGNKLAAMIRTYEQQNNKITIPIIGLTAHTIEISQDKSVSSGMSMLLSKPLKLELLTQVLTELLPQKTENPLQKSREVKVLTNDIELDKLNE